MIFHEISCFFRIDFWIDFLSGVLMESELPKWFSGDFSHQEWLPKWSRDLDPEDRFLACILVALWLPFGIPLAPLGSLWAPFWLPFGSLWLPLGAMWVAPFWHPPGSFSHFWQHCGFVFAFFMFFCSKFAPTFHFGRIFEQNIFFGKPVRKTSGTAARAHNQKELSKGIPSSQGPERNLAEGNLDPLRARRRPGVLACVRSFSISTPPKAGNLLYLFFFFSLLSILLNCMSPRHFPGTPLRALAHFFATFFRIDFFMDFWWILAPVLTYFFMFFSCLLHHFFGHDFHMDFSLIVVRLLDRWTLGDTHSTAAG